MCVTSSPSILSNTKITVAVDVTDSSYHHLVYGNKAVSRGAKKLHKRSVLTLTNDGLVETENEVKSSKNSLIIPIPTTESIIFIDTKSYGNELNKVFEFYENCLQGGKSRPTEVMRSVETVIVGLYTYVHGNSEDILEIAERGEIEVSEELANFYKTNYKGWKLVLCIWEDGIDTSCDPCHIKYKADLFPTDLFIYLMDAHDGNAPKNENVRRDQKVLVSIPGRKSGFSVFVPEGGKALLNIGQKINCSWDLLTKLPLSGDLYYLALNSKFLNNGNLPNGDMWINLTADKKFTTHQLIFTDNNLSENCLDGCTFVFTPPSDENKIKYV